VERKQRTLASTKERVVATVLLAVVRDTWQSCGEEELEERSGGRGRGRRRSPSRCTDSRIEEYQGLSKIWDCQRRTTAGRRYGLADAAAAG